MSERVIARKVALLTFPGKGTQLTIEAIPLSPTRNRKVVTVHGFSYE